MYVLLASLTIAVLSASQAVPLDIDSRIVNGTDVNIRDYPYMVSLQYDGRHLCGGSIIDKYNILTAAHCVATRDLEGFTVLPGSTIVTYGTFMLIERIIVHSGYTGLKPYRNDIAIVHLAQPLEFSERVKPIQLPKVFEAIPEFSEATLTGWGYHMVSLQFNGFHACGGSIIDKYNILTAAHCFEALLYVFNISHFTILAGTTSITKNYRWLISIERVFIHESYIDNLPYSNDVALLHLAEPLEFNENVQPIQLPKAFEPIAEFSTAVLTGWGLNSSNHGTEQDTLQEVNITVYSDSQCETLHAETGPTSRITHVCAGIPEGGKGQCTGDSGGPLVVNGIQIGIVSWSKKPCTLAGYPGVFARVSTYIDWIQCNLKRV